MARYLDIPFILLAPILYDFIAVLGVSCLAVPSSPLSLFASLSMLQPTED